MTVVADATGRRRASAGAALRCSGAWPECDDGGRVEQQWQAPVSWRVNPYDRIWQRFAGQVVITGAQRNRQATRLPLEAKGPGGRQLFDKAGAVARVQTGGGRRCSCRPMSQPADVERWWRGGGGISQSARWSSTPPPSMATSFMPHVEFDWRGHHRAACSLEPVRSLRMPSGDRAHRTSAPFLRGNSSMRGRLMARAKARSSLTFAMLTCRRTTSRQRHWD